MARWRSDAERAIHRLRQVTTWDLVDGAWAPRIAVEQQERFALLAVAASRRGPHAIPVLLRLSLEPEPVGSEAIRRVLQLLTDLRPLERAWLDRRIRRGGIWERWHANGAPYQVTRASKWARPSAPVARLGEETMRRLLDDLPDSAWLLLSMSPDGHQRERSIERLAATGGAPAIAHLLLRTFDWVSPVRGAAIAAVVDDFTNWPDTDLVTTLSLVHHLMGRARVDDDPAGRAPNALALLDWVSVRLDEPERRPLLVARLFAGDAAERRACFRQLRRRGLSADELAAVLQSADLALQREALRQAAGLPAAERLALLRLATHESLSNVRCDALEELLAVASEEATARLWEALFDPADRVRQFARWHLRDHRDDVLDAYRAAVQPDAPLPRLRAALMALADMEKDWWTAEPFLSSPDPAVRAVALKAVARADRDTAQELLPALVADLDPHVSWSAAVALHGTGALPAVTVGPLLASGIPHVVRSAARLVPLTGAWPSLAFSLALYSSEDAEGRAVGRDLVAQWVTGLWALPSAPLDDDDQDTIVAALDRMGWAPAVVKDALRRHGVDVEGWTDREFDETT
jgi:hypothetical protein